MEIAHGLTGDLEPLEDRYAGTGERRKGPAEPRQSGAVGQPSEQRDAKDEPVHRRASRLAPANAPNRRHRGDGHDARRRGPPAERLRSAHHDPGGEGQLGVEPGVELGEDRHDPPQDDRDDRDADSADHEGIGEGAPHLGRGLGRLLQLGREPEETVVEPSAGLSDAGHGHRESVEHLRMASHGAREGTPGANGPGNRSDRAPQPAVVLLAVEHGEALRERQPGADHHRELTDQYRHLTTTHRQGERRAGRSIRFARIEPDRRGRSGSAAPRHRGEAGNRRKAHHTTWSPPGRRRAASPSGSFDAARASEATTTPRRTRDRSASFSDADRARPAPASMTARS